MKGTVILATLDYPPRKGGVATYLAHLVRAMPKGSMHILASKDGDTHEFDMREDAPIYRRHLLLRFFRPRWLAALYWTNWLRRKEKPSMLIVSHVLPMGKIARILRRLFGLPYVVILHGFDIALALDAKGKKLFDTKNILADAELVVANSEYTAGLAARAGVSKDRMMIVRPSPGISPETTVTPVHVKELRAHYGLGFGFVVLSLGRLVTRKGFDTLIEAIAVLRKRGEEVTLFIVGDGPEKKNLEHLAWEHGVTENVRFAGAVTDAELPALYASCDTFAMVPRSIGPDVEGFGIVYLEAGLMGKPVIGSRTGGVPDAVLDGKTGLLVPSDDPAALADAIVRLKNDPALAANLGVAGRLRAITEFDPELQMQPLIDFLTDKTPTPLVSIVIPTYQHAREIRLCLESIFQQTYTNYEIIVVNDGSTDSTTEVLQPYLSRITLITQENHGGNAARNRGYREAKGELLLFCDADAIMQPGMLTKMVATLHAHPEVSYAYSSFRFGWKLFRLWAFDPEILRKMNYIHTTSLIRREHFPGFDEKIVRLQDWDLWLTMLEQGHRGVWIPKCLFQCLPHKGGISLWVPKIFNVIPWRKLGIKMKNMERLEEARKVLHKKHRLS